MDTELTTIVDRVKQMMNDKASVLDIVIVVMEEVEQTSGLSGADKKQYVLNVVLDICEVEADRQTISNMIEAVIKLSKGAYEINQATGGIFGCCFGK